MPRTRAAAGQSSQGRKKTVRPPQGWRTTDEDEIERRRQRAAAESLAVETLEPAHPVFGTFRVSSETGSSYEVEIRDLSSHDNSCGCPDYEVNGLGTCKHVEAVLAQVRTLRQAKTSKPRIEVFLRRTGETPEVRALGLERSGPSAAQALADRYFTTKGIPGWSPGGRARPSGRPAGPVATVNGLNEAAKLCGYLPDYLPEGEPIRIVTVYGEIGRPCQGTHVNDLREIGKLEIISVKSKKATTTVSYWLEGMD